MSSNAKTSLSSTWTSSAPSSILLSSSLGSPFSASFPGWPSSDSFGASSLLASSSAAFSSPSSFSSFSAFSSLPSASFLSCLPCDWRFLLECHLSSCHWWCFWRQSCNCFVHELYWSRNHVPGCKSSTFCVSLRSPIQTFKYSAHFSAFCHSNLTSSKPSSLAGMVNLPKFWPKSFFVRSSTVGFRNHLAFSSSVSAAASSAFFTASSNVSSGSFFSSSAASPSGFSGLPAGGGGGRRRSSWPFLRLTSFPAFRFFSSKANCCIVAL
mmetsp:Transcript_3873/g.8726  ORF Transcript_3873/g.8726 Transcript_3873/m.8726 type:complete len:267 (-) Transcript_3873:913-1713(-)